MRKALHESAAKPEEAAVLTKAVFRAAERLRLSARVLAAVIGVSEATASRMKHGGLALEAGSKPFELAALVVRMFRSLDAITGGDEQTARAWMESENLSLGGTPIERIRTVSGLVDVVHYLDARRARV